MLVMVNECKDDERQSMYTIYIHESCNNVNHDGIFICVSFYLFAHFSIFYTKQGGSQKFSRGGILNCLYEKFQPFEKISNRGGGFVTRFSPGYAPDTKFYLYNTNVKSVKLENPLLAHSFIHSFYSYHFLSFLLFVKHYEEIIFMAQHKFSSTLFLCFPLYPSSSSYSFSYSSLLCMA